MKPCCPPGQGCNAPAGREEGCFLQKCRHAASPQADRAVELWVSFITAQREHQARRHRRFLRRAYARARRSGGPLAPAAPLIRKISPNCGYLFSGTPIWGSLDLSDGPCAPAERGHRAGSGSRMKACCPPGQGCNAPAGREEPCFLQKCRSSDSPQAHRALALWDSFTNAREDHRSDASGAFCVAPTHEPATVRCPGVRGSSEPIPAPCAGRHDEL